MRCRWGAVRVRAEHLGSGAERSAPGKDAGQLGQYYLRCVRVLHELQRRACCVGDAGWKSLEMTPYLSTAGNLGAVVYESVHGSKSDTPVAATFLVSRVTRVRLCRMAVAANNASITLTCTPLEPVNPERCPHRSATSWSTLRIRSENRNGSSLLSQVSSAVRRALRGRGTIPLRISPKVRTLKYKRSSSVVSIHAVTFGSGFGLTSSEMMFVSSKNALTVRPSGHNRACA